MASSGADAAAIAAAADVLKLARQATGVPDLHPYKLRVENGQLVKLDLRGLKLAALPDSIGQLGALQDLNLGGNELASLPASLCVQLTALKKLNLSGNKLSSVPDGIGRLTALTELDVRENKLASLPADLPTGLQVLWLSRNLLASLPTNIGQLSSLTKLDASLNKLASLPESIGQLTALTGLWLSGNQISALPERIGTLAKLTTLDLSSNQLVRIPASVGHMTALSWLKLDHNKLQSLPDELGLLTNCVHLDVSGNAITLIPDSVLKLGVRKLDVSDQATVKLRTIPVRDALDQLCVVVHALMGYADLVTDVLAIVQFGQQGQEGLMGLNIIFLLLSLIVDVLLQSDLRGRALVVLHLQQALQAFETIRVGYQTESFVRSKKVDAVCRSVPSIVLQLYGLLLTLPGLDSTGVATISLSIASGVLGSAMTLGSLAPKSGDSVFSRAFAVHFLYFICELIMRLFSTSLLFVSLGAGAFGLLTIDFLLRLWAAWRLARKKWSVTVFILALLWFGSDGINGPGMWEASVHSLVSTAVLFISLLLVNLLGTPPSLLALRANQGSPVQALTALACLGLLFKHLLGLYIHRAEFNQPGQSAQSSDTSLRASRNVRFDLAYGNDSSTLHHHHHQQQQQADAIPKRLPTDSSAAQLRVASTKIMHDNPLQLANPIHRIDSL